METARQIMGAVWFYSLAVLVVALVVVVIVGGGQGVIDQVRVKAAKVAAERARLLRVAAEENERTAGALASTADHERQRARFEAARRDIESGG